MPTLKVLQNGSRKYVVKITGDFTTVDSAADVTNAVVVNRSTLIGPDRINLPTYIRVDEITFIIGSGYNYAVIDFDDATDENIAFMQGQGYIDYRPHGGLSMSAAPTTATEGDIQLTTSGGAAGDSYSILLNCSLKN